MHRKFAALQQNHQNYHLFHETIPLTLSVVWQCTLQVYTHIWTIFPSWFQCQLNTVTLKGIVLRDGVSTVAIGLNNLTCIVFTLVKLHIKNIRRCKQGECRCRWGQTELQYHGLAQLKDTLGRPLSSDRGSPQQVLSLGNPPSNLDSWLWNPQYDHFFVAICSLNTAVCHGPRYTFERRLPQQREIQYQPFYVDSPPVCCIIYFRRATWKV
jgi:hypothetical protein